MMREKEELCEVVCVSGGERSNPKTQPTHHGMSGMMTMMFTIMITMK